MDNGQLGLGSNYCPLNLTLTPTLTLTLTLIFHEMYIVHVIYPKIFRCPWKSHDPDNFFKINKALKLLILKKFYYKSDF